MYEERDEVRDNTRRLARFRLALEGMGLFTEPRVEPLGDLQEGTTHANRTKATLRRQVGKGHMVGCRKLSEALSSVE